MIISPSLAVFLTTTLLIPDLGKVFSMNALSLISSTKKSAPALLVLLNRSHGRDFTIPTLIPIGLTFCHIITFKPSKIFKWHYLYLAGVFLAFGALTGLAAFSIFSTFLAFGATSFKTTCT